MKTLKALLIFTAATAAITASAGEPLQSPRGSQVGPAVVASAGVQDPNLISATRLGKYTAEPATLASTTKDPNLVASITGCPMAPKAKGTPECEKHCESAKK